MDDRDEPRQFSSWHPLSESGLEEYAPSQPAAVQVRLADGLVDYPDGHSAMVGYLVASESVRDALARLFDDEIESPGARGLGPLEFRTYSGAGARRWMARLMFKFEDTFGAMPLFNQPSDEHATR